jgi:hypothetical protein
MKTNTREFWDFSFFEMGLFDLPANIDYILEATKKNDLTYIGHSQGTSAFWVMDRMRHDFELVRVDVVLTQ